MDTSAIFRQLTAGISFDKKKYRDDAQIFGLTKKYVNTNSDSVKNAPISIDYPESGILVDDNTEGDSNDDSNVDDDEDFKLLGNEVIASKKDKPRKKHKKKSSAQIFKLHQENINQFRNVNKIHVNGSDIPDPIDSWDKLSKGKYCLPERLLDAITSNAHGYSAPTPIQMQAIPLLLGIVQILVCIRKRYLLIIARESLTLNLTGPVWVQFIVG